MISFFVDDAGQRVRFTFAEAHRETFAFVEQAHLSKLFSCKENQLV